MQKLTTSAINKANPRRVVTTEDIDRSRRLIHSLTPRRVVTTEDVENSRRRVHQIIGAWQRRRNRNQFAR